MSKGRVLVLLSGGLDSSVMMADLKVRGFDVGAISFDYGQRNAREVDAAIGIARCLGVLEHSIVSLPFLRSRRGNSQTDPSVSLPQGNATDESMRVTVVPNRNMILLAVAASEAIASNYRWLAYAAHVGAGTIYADCRPEFVEAMDVALALCNHPGIRLVTTYADWTKAEIVKRGVELFVPLERTWSCYSDHDQHCGQCGACSARRAAFKQAGVTDLTTYEA